MNLINLIDLIPNQRGHFSGGGHGYITTYSGTLSATDSIEHGQTSTIWSWEVIFEEYFLFLFDFISFLFFWCSHLHLSTASRAAKVKDSGIEVLGLFVERLFVEPFSSNDFSSNGSFAEVLFAEVFCRSTFRQTDVSSNEFSPKCFSSNERITYPPTYLPT